MVDPNEVRQKYLKFFESKKHLIYPSASLKSEDPGLLFSVAGMQQFKPYFQGAKPIFPGYEGVWPRVTTSQKCMRAGGKDSDIENIGRTRRHHTFFEMLGNFSFGDYFKREAANWAWEFLTSKEWLGLEPERLYVTVFNDDDEAYDIWVNEVGIPKDHMSRWGEGENFWPANAIKDDRSGPCGPCSEIFYDRGPDFGSPDETGPNTGSGDRYTEIWNLVFTQFDLNDGVLTPLPQQNIDTGMGLERLVTVVSGAKDAYSTEIFQPTIRKIVEFTGKSYEDLKSVEHRIIADHMRSITFAITDGILPGNEGAGYVVKMLIRRASRQAYKLGLNEPFLYKMVSCVVESMGKAYPSVAEAQERVQAIIKNEEEQFLKTLESGVRRVNHLLDELDGDTLDGELAFKLWETHGFPLEITRDMAYERGIKVDEAGYKIAQAKHSEASGSGQVKNAMLADTSEALDTLLAEHGETRFLGYTTSHDEARVIGLIQDKELVSEVGEGSSLGIVLDQTPFYAEGGGQIGDSGKLEWSGGAAIISGTQTSPQGLFIHQAKIVRGKLVQGQSITATVDPGRVETQKHHSATHLLHAALRSVLGTHVAQAGSSVTPERLRFDFSHTGAVTDAELAKIETLVNRWIQADFAVNWRVVPIAEARAAGAMMLFGEKYGEQVRMVRMGGDDSSVSVELCGGTHVARTGEIGSLFVTSEEAVSSGIRRIEAVTGMAALNYAQGLRSSTTSVARQLGVKADDLAERIEKLQDDLKASQRDNATLRDKLAAAQVSGGASSELKEANGYSYVATILEGLDATALRNAADNLLKKSKADLVVLASGTLLVTKTSKEGQAKGAHAGNIIREIAKRAGGGGGGKPDMAQAGVKDTAKLAEAFDALPEILA
ncbi:MAG: alanine--tRNA ligase [Trueperaceae bacterium]|nr:alanine--tRNA ligase [Trueperaceae bacterium]